MSIKLPLLQKMFFYSSYFIYKVISIWFEVKRPKLKMFVYEMLYSAMKLVDYTSQIPPPFRIDYVETCFGRFRVRPHTSDLISVSPAYERRDMDHLSEIVDSLLEEGSTVLFLDIGADIGAFTVSVGNRFGSNPRLAIMAFEPSGSSFRVLEENVRNLNGIRAELVKTALWSSDGIVLDYEFNPEAPGTSHLTGNSGIFEVEKVTTRTLDSVIGDTFSHFDAFVLKMDVEGSEEEILKGAQELLLSGKEIYILIEDFVRQEIIDYLESTGARFLTKLTPYNSFWKYGA